jgi:cytochrome P450
MFRKGSTLTQTAPTLINNLYCIGAHKDVQERLFDEICTATECSRHCHIDDAAAPPLSLEHLNRMPYLNACIKEAFRLYPVGTDVSRITQTPLVLSGYQVPADVSACTRVRTCAQTPIEMNMGPALRDEKYFEAPDEFRPQRWLRGSATNNVHPFLLLPFGHGTRMCAGVCVRAR